MSRHAIIDVPPGELERLGLSERDIEGGRRLFARPWTFLLSAPAIEFLPPAGPAEIALAGRSNVGKSSLINAIVGRSGLARTSNTPGRTQELNFYLTADVPLRLVDMPGYGFAKAPKAAVDAWTDLVKSYLRGRTVLRRVLLLIDSRHGLKAVDREILAVLGEAAVTYQVVLTKADKITPQALAKLVEATTQVLRKEPAAFPAVLATSSETGLGIQEVRASIHAAALLDMEL